MRDGRIRVTTSHRLQPFYSDPGPRQPQGLTPMNISFARMRNREVSERKQVGDAESLMNIEKRR
ncbi:hypothetical protein PHISCL_10113 [Aspergillus sclerotialis]|uniref:Uncharacterized protein n=1 Tax=Aspergillus sclerotialis TaxID=2070753 RepID=A0A3A2Z3E3_9EURO|nr:hypothetical protein PHISCL_10113 [Aspergillus sclerotialis]